LNHGVVAIKRNLSTKHCQRDHDPGGGAFFYSNFLSMKNFLSKEHIPFTQVPNELINDHEISLRARMIYVFMASKPEGWNFTLKSMAAQLGEGARSVGSATKQLKEKGWLKYTKTNEGKGLYTLCLSPSGKKGIEHIVLNADSAPCKNRKQQNVPPISNKENISNTDLDSNKDKIDNPTDSQPKEEDVSVFKSQEKKYFKDVRAVEVGLFSKDEKKWYDTAAAFYGVFEKNLIERGSITAQLEKVRFKPFIDPIRLMYDVDLLSHRQMGDLYKFLQKDEFWKGNILSTTKLRKQVSQLLIKANSNGRTTTHGQREPQYSDDFKRRLFAKLHPGQEYKSAQSH